MSEDLTHAAARAFFERGEILSADNRALRAEIEWLRAENAGLREDLTRWKAHTRQAIHAPPEPPHAGICPVCHLGKDGVPTRAAIGKPPT